MSFLILLLSNHESQLFVHPTKVTAACSMILCGELEEEGGETTLIDQRAVAAGKNLKDGLSH